MAYENDQYRDENGEPLMNYDDDFTVGSDESVEPHQVDRLPTTVHGTDDHAPSPKSKPKKKRLTKKRKLADDASADIKEEMWKLVTGDNLDDDQNGVVRNKYDNVRRPKEDEDINELFKFGKKRKKEEKDPVELGMMIERVMAELEVAAEDDVELNKQGKPAINKLKKLPLLKEMLSKKPLQKDFLDHGVLSLLKSWLELLPDRSLPNINVRAAVLEILNDLPLDLENFERREQLKDSGLGRVIMFMSKSDEETTSNRKLAKEVVAKWSRPIFNKSTRFEDMRNIDDDHEIERAPYTRSPVKKLEDDNFDSLDDDFARARKSSDQSSARSRQQHASRPEATMMDFMVRPKSKIDFDEIEARRKQTKLQDQRRAGLNKKLQHLKSQKKKKFQATRPSLKSL